MLSAETEFSVAFYDVDSMDMVWHGNYVKFFELARCALLDKIGYGYREMKESGYAFPVTDISMKFIRPLGFRDRVTVRAELEEYENCLRIHYEMRETETGNVTTRGRSTQMAVNMASGESCFACPEVFIAKVRALLP